MVEEKAAHPIEKMMLSNPSTGVLFWAFCTAVIAAPLVEEIFIPRDFAGMVGKSVCKNQKVRRGAGGR